MSSLFSGRKVVIATMHGKESVLEPMLSSLHLHVEFLEELDTDQFGTFSGEIPRIDNPLETLRKKCIHAYECSDIDLIIASEGSFGAHPFIPFVSADEELLMLKDFKNDIEIVVKELSTETNFDGKKISDLDELMNFAEKAGFPEHALILKCEDRVEKGIVERSLLERIFLEFQVMNHRAILVETDMRAMNNPSRMKVISKAAEKLKNAILSECPKCHWPDYTIKKVLTGLPCGLCQMPTVPVRAQVIYCNHCGKTEEIPVQKAFQDPMYCNYCNP